MATNKRKDAAALFELIDRSTLKVPKNAGALKIPSWWSSKTNPATTAEGASGEHPARQTPVQARSARVQPASPQPSAPVDAGKTQSKLFEPPPADVEPGASPSIRPPSARIPAPISPPVKVSTPSPAPLPQVAAPSPAAEPVPELKPTEPISEADLPPDVPDLPPPPGARQARVFAPQTHSQDRKPWSPPRPGSFARLPTWVLVVGIAVIVIAVAGIIMWGKSKEANPQTKPVPRGENAATGVGGGILPAPMTGRAGAQTGRGNSAGGATQQAPQSGPVRVGTTYPAMTYQYDPAKFYIQACSTLSLSTAQTDAGWLTELGIDVAIEPYVSQGRTWYALIVLQGFSSQTEAEPARRQIVQIGNSHVPNAWNTAQVKHVVRTAGTAPAARGRMP